jgi:hypothetical protein
MGRRLRLAAPAAPAGVARQDREGHRSRSKLEGAMRGYATSARIERKEAVQRAELNLDR